MLFSAFSAFFVFGFPKPIFVFLCVSQRDLRVSAVRIHVYGTSALTHPEMQRIIWKIIRVAGGED